MPINMRLLSRTSLPLLAALVAAGSAWAEKADRYLPMVVESDGKDAAHADLKNKTSTFTGNVTITQGTMLIKADRVDVHEVSDGVFMAEGKATTGKQVTFREKSDSGPNEYFEGQADRVEYDGAKNVVTLLGNAWVRRRQDGRVVSEMTSAVITYNQDTDEVYSSGQPSRPAAAGGSPGKARAVFIPKAAPSAPAAGASSAGGSGTK